MQITLTLLALLPFTAMFAASYDPYAEFGSTNPSGVWTYGYSSTVGGSVTNFSDYFADPAPQANGQLAGWVTTTVDPFLGIYKSPAVAELLLHPGPAGQYALLRFTAPETAVFQFAGSFRGIDVATTDVHILTNSIAAFDGTISGQNDQEVFSDSVALVTGQTIDFLVGFGSNGTYQQDATGLTLTLTSSPAADIPEPRTTAMLAVLAVWMGIRRGRR